MCSSDLHARTHASTSTQKNIHAPSRVQSAAQIFLIKAICKYISTHSVACALPRIVLGYGRSESTCCTRLRASRANTHNHAHKQVWFSHDYSTLWKISSQRESIAHIHPCLHPRTHAHSCTLAHVHKHTRVPGYEVLYKNVFGT